MPKKIDLDATAYFDVATGALVRRPFPLKAMSRPPPRKPTPNDPPTHEASARRRRQRRMALINGDVFACRLKARAEPT
jgi:hypothetical protein